MPTLSQLTQAVVVNATDQLLLQQGEDTLAVTVDLLLQETQESLTLAPGALLGRVSFLPGGPEAVAIGPGLLIEDGALAADPTVLAPLASPALTGRPTAPTPPVGDDSTRIATTAFVQANQPSITVRGDITGSGTTVLDLSLPSIVAPGTFPKVTVSTKGLVTAGGPLAAADISGALGFTPYDAANPAAYTSAASLAVFPATAYGARFDGVTDDTAAIQAAISAAYAAGGGDVLLPQGTAIIGTAGTGLVLQGPKVNLLGHGGGTAGLGSSQTAATILQWGGGVAPGAAVVTIRGSAVGGHPYSGRVGGFLADCQSRCGTAFLVMSAWRSEFDFCFLNPTAFGILWDYDPNVPPPNNSEYNRVCVDGALTYALSGAVGMQFSRKPNGPIDAAGDGDPDLNVFDRVYIAYNNGTGMVLGGSDHNLFNQVTLWRADFTTGTGIVFCNGINYAFGSYGNVFRYLDTQGGAIVCEGSDTGITVAYGRYSGVGTPALTATTANTGTGSASVAANNVNAQAGHWLLTATSPTSFTATLYAGFGDLTAPASQSFAAPITVGTQWFAYGPNNGLGITITAGGTPFAPGDMILICVPFPSSGNRIATIDRDNGTPLPTVGLNATVFVGDDAGIEYGPWAKNAVLGDAATTIQHLVTYGTTAALTIGADGGSPHVSLWSSGYAYNLTATLSNASGHLVFSQPLEAIPPPAGDSSNTLATTSWIGAHYAPLAAPTFSGTVTVAGALLAPTPAASDSSTHVATTAYVQAQGYVPQVASVAALRALAYAGVATGTPAMVLAYAAAGDGGAGLFIWNAASTAADNGGTIIKPTGNAGAGRWLRQLPDGRVTPQMFGAKGDGVTDDSAAFTAALATGPTIVPAATYVIGNVAVPSGAWMEGGAGLGYSGDIGAGTPGSAQQAAVVSPILLAKTGTTSCILNVNGCHDATFKGLFLDGVTTSCDGISSGSTQLMLERITVTRCVNGLGATSTAGYTGLSDLYTHVATLINCEFCNNTNGIANLIDTNMVAGAVSANVTGINLGSGANGNTFVGCRYEWNSQDGVQGYACASNVFVGGLFDRNSWRGVNLGSGCADFTFNGVQFNRNGASNSYPNNSHVALNGTSSVFFNGCVSKTGQNDNGTGAITPAYFVNYLNSNALVTISGCDVSGYVTGFAFGANPTSYVQRDNDGAGDTLVNAARPYIANGVACQTPWAKAAANVAPGASTSIAMGASPFTNNYSVISRELVVTATNNNAPYQTCAARFNLAFYRGGASVNTPSSSAAYGEAGGTGVITWGGSGKLQLSASSVASDGSSWTLNILNGGTGDGSNWSVFAELH